MATATNGTLRSVIRLIEVQALRGVSDPELIQRFVASNDDLAFRVIAERHGPMVLGVCRRALGCPHDAEDAFQATFLVFARSAQSIRNSESLGSWLHGIARRVSSKLVRERERRAQREQSIVPRAQADPAEELTWAEVRAGLDEELGRLPQHYRDVLVCCYLEGKTRDEAAQQLGVSLGALHGQLERARKLLAERLTARGLSLSVTGLAVAVSPSIASATVRAGSLFAASQSVSGLVSPGVLSLTNEVLRGMVMTKVKLFGASCLAIVVVCASVGLGLSQDKPTKGVGSLEDIKLSVRVLERLEIKDTDAEFIRRLSLDLRGTMPTTTEVHFFVQNKDAKKRETLIDLFVKERAAAKDREEKQKAKEATDRMVERAHSQLAKSVAEALRAQMTKEKAEKEAAKALNDANLAKRKRLIEEEDRAAKEAAEKAKAALIKQQYEQYLQRVAEMSREQAEKERADQAAREKALATELDLLKNKVELAKLTIREKQLLLAAAKSKKSESPAEAAEQKQKVELLMIDLERAALLLREAELNLDVARKTPERRTPPKVDPKSK